MAHLLGDHIVEDDEKIANMLVERGFGTIGNEGLMLSPTEALYLLENNRIKIKDGDKEISFKELLKRFKNDKEIELKYAVYSDLRKKGYIVKSGFRFGTYFRLYEKGIRPGEGKTSFLIEIIPENKNLKIKDIQKSIKIAQFVKKNLILAIVDNDKRIQYIKLNRIQM